VTDIHMDSTVLCALREVMEAGYADLLDTFLADSQEHLARLHNAQDASELARVAHSFKGSSSNMGALRLALLCGELEDSARKRPLSGLAELVGKIDYEFQHVQRLYKLERQRCGSPSLISR